MVENGDGALAVVDGVGVTDGAGATVAGAVVAGAAGVPVLPDSSGRDDDAAPGSVGSWTPPRCPQPAMPTASSVTRAMVLRPTVPYSFTVDTLRVVLRDVPLSSVTVSRTVYVPGSR